MMESWPTWIGGPTGAVWGPDYIGFELIDWKRVKDGVCSLDVVERGAPA